MTYDGYGRLASKHVPEQAVGGNIPIPTRRTIRYGQLQTHEVQRFYIAIIAAS